MGIMISAWEKLECLTVDASVLKNNFKQENDFRKNKENLRISPQVTNIQETTENVKRVTVIN